MKTELAAERRLQRLRPHAGSGGLDGVEHVHAQPDEVRDEAPNIAAAMVKHPPAQMVDTVDHLLEVRRHKGLEHGGRDQRPALRPQIADQEVKVDPASGDFRRAGVILQVEIGEFAAEVCGGVGNPLRWHILSRKG